MQRDFLLPDVGEGLEDATVVRWHVRVGDRVGLNDPLVTIETAKASVELPSPFEGRVVLINASEGDELRVGELLARIETTAGEGARAGSGTEGTGHRGPDPLGNDGSSTRQPVLVGYGVDPAPGPATSRRQWRRPKGSGPPASRHRQTGDDRSPPPAAPLEPPGRPLATPPVRWLARTLDVDLGHVRPTGAHGEVTREDVHAAAASASPARQSTAPGAPAHLERQREEQPAWWPTGGGGSPLVAGTAGRGGAHPGSGDGDVVEELPVRGVRARIAERMSLSRSTIPEATCGLWVDCERLLALRGALGDDLRERFDEGGRTADLLTPFAVLAWMVPFALQAAPLLNASFDAEAKVVRVQRAVHLGVATSTDAGLLVPVVRGAHALGLHEFAGELGRLTGAARAGTLAPAELTGSTFTVTNYGALGLDDGNPVINAPEAAILGVGTIAPRAAVHDGALAVRSTAKLICAFDHRVSDGADAARFLRRLKAFVERPELLLGTR